MLRLLRHKKREQETAGRSMSLKHNKQKRPYHFLRHGPFQPTPRKASHIPSGLYVEGALSTELHVYQYQRLARKCLPTGHVTNEAHLHKSPGINEA